jgi:DNA-binding MarR family transcriptional regulator
LYVPQDPNVNDVAAALQMSIGLCIRQLRQMPAEGDLSLPEASVLKRLDRSGPSSVTELAKAEQISVQSMGTTLGALEARGLVQRHPHPTDGRRSVLSITKSGTRVLSDKHNGRAEQLAKALSAGFSPAELRQLMVAAPLIERLAQSL